MKTKIEHKDAKDAKRSSLRSLRLCVFLFFATLPCAFAASVNNGAGTGAVTSTSIVMGWGVVSTNTTNPVVKVFWGQFSGGTNAAYWTSSTNIGATAVGTGTVTAVSLTAGRLYYGRAMGYEGTTTNWASSDMSAWTSANAPTNTDATVYRPVMVNTNGVLAAPTNFFGANSVGIIGGAAGNVPQWFEAPTNDGGLVVYSEDVTGGLVNWTISQLISFGTLGSAVTNATTDFAPASHNQPLATITNAGTIAGRASNDFMLASSGVATNPTFIGQITANTDTSAWHYVTIPMDGAGALGDASGLSTYAANSTNAMGPFGQNGHQWFSSGFRTAVITRVYSTLNTNNTIFVYCYYASTASYTTTNKLDPTNQDSADAGGWPPIRVWTIDKPIRQFDRIYIQCATTNPSSDYVPWMTIQMKGKP